MPTPKVKSDMPKRGLMIAPKAIDKESHLVELHPSEFLFDHRVQREVNEARVAMMALQFQPHSMGMIIASKREDGVYVLDGGHRVSAAKAVGWDGLIPTKLWEGLTLQEEAQLFLTLNNVRAVQAIDMFKVRVTLEDDAAVNINKILKHWGLNVDWAGNTQRRTVSAIVALEKVYYGAGVRSHGTHADLVDSVIRALSAAYGVEPERIVWSGTILEGMGIFIATYGKRLDKQRLTRTLQKVTPAQFIARARSRKDTEKGTLAWNFAHILRNEYNNGNRNKLPHFHEVDPRNNAPEDDPLYVDPNQFVLAGVG